LDITQRSVTVKYDHSEEIYSSRKLIPVNPKTFGDQLHLKRIEASRFSNRPLVARRCGMTSTIRALSVHGKVDQNC